MKTLILIATLALVGESLKADDDWQINYHLEEQTRAINRQTRILEKAEQRREDEAEARYFEQQRNRRLEAVIYIWQQMSPQERAQFNREWQQLTPQERAQIIRNLQ